LRGHQQQLTDAVQRVVLAARWPAAHAGLRCIYGCCGNTPTRVQLCALYPSINSNAGAMAEETAERAKLLLRGLSPHRQAWTLTAHPNAYGVGLNDPETTTDQRLRWSVSVWSPPPEFNRRPHPYHGTTRNRCANRRSPRSRPTVRAEVIGSAEAKLCAHSPGHAVRHVTEPTYPTNDP
jgi:hypothetical protein